MGSRGPAGAAHVADDLAPGDVLALADDVAAHVAVEGGEAVAVVDGDVVAVGRSVGGRRDGSGGAGAGPDP